MTDIVLEVIDGKGTYKRDTWFIYEGNNIKVISDEKMRVISKRSNEKSINK